MKRRGAVIPPFFTFSLQVPINSYMLSWKAAGDEAYGYYKMEKRSCAYRGLQGN
jgi:hypothetical protein